MTNTNEYIYSQIIEGNRSAWLTRKTLKSNIPLYKTFEDKKELVIHENVTIFL